MATLNYPDATLNYFEEQWVPVEQGITKMKEILENSPNPVFEIEESMKLYTVIYNLIVGCMHRRRYTKEVYVKYCEVIEEYIASVILPSLKNKQDQDLMMMKEFVHQWGKYKVLGQWLFRIFQYLNEAKQRNHSDPSIETIVINCFHDRVYKEFKGKITHVIMNLIDLEREGEQQIDVALLKTVLGIFAEIEKEDTIIYEQEFESRMIAYYSRKAYSWILGNSCLDYIMKTEECLKKERERIFYYLDSICREQKMMERLQHELLSVHQNQLLEKLQSECITLLRGENFDFLSKLFELVYEKIPRSGEAMANILKQRIVEDGSDLVEKAETVGINQNASAQEIFVGKVIELHAKYGACVNGCFMNKELFQYAMNEGFEIIRNKVTASVSIGEISDPVFDKLKI